MDSKDIVFATDFDDFGENEVIEAVEGTLEDCERFLLRKYPFMTSDLFQEMDKPFEVIVYDDLGDKVWTHEGTRYHKVGLIHIAPGAEFDYIAPTITGVAAPAAGGRRRGRRTARRRTIRRHRTTKRKN